MFRLPGISLSNGRRPRHGERPFREGACAAAFSREIERHGSSRAMKTFRQPHASLTNGNAGWIQGYGFSECPAQPATPDATHQRSQLGHGIAFLCLEAHRLDAHFIRCSCMTSRRLGFDGSAQTCVHRAPDCTLKGAEYQRELAHAGRFRVGTSMGRFRQAAYTCVYERIKANGSTCHARMYVLRFCCVPMVINSGSCRLLLQLLPFPISSFLFNARNSLRALHLRCHGSKRMDSVYKVQIFPLSAVVGELDAQPKDAIYILGTAAKVAPKVYAEIIEAVTLNCGQASPGVSTMHPLPGVALFLVYARSIARDMPLAGT
jgi:hypothetical protein